MIVPSSNMEPSGVTIYVFFLFFFIYDSDFIVVFLYQSCTVPQMCSPPAPSPDTEPLLQRFSQALPSSTASDLLPTHRPCPSVYFTHKKTFKPLTRVLRPRFLKL